MATRRRIGVSTATTEAARRQLMQPVPCWEKIWVTPQDLPSGSSLKVYKWVKTDKKQNFSDDEDEPDMPLAPLPDEPEGFEDMEQDENAGSVGPEAASRAVSEPVAAPEPEPEESTPARPKPHPLSMSLVPSSPSPVPEGDETIDESLKPLDSNLDDSTVLDDSVVLDNVGGGDLQVPLELNTDIGDLDMSGLGPDGEQFEEAGDLSQLQPGDPLLGAEVLGDNTDPFNPPQ